MNGRSSRLLPRALWDTLVIMFANQCVHKSVDSLSITASVGSHADCSFHNSRRRSKSPSHHLPTTRRNSTASSIHSIGGSLDTPGTRQSDVLESGQNAISTLLQPPIVRTGLLAHTTPPASRALKAPTARDIPPVALTNILHVDASEFKPYLAKVGALYEQLKKAKESEEEHASVPYKRSDRPDDGLDALDDSHLRPRRRPSAPPRKPSTASITSISSLKAPSPVGRNSSGFRSGATRGPPPLCTIPAVYFDQDFHLENPRTFDVVSERSEVIRPAPGVEEKHGAIRKALATNAILQEKLSWYMDTIEMHLIQSISAASTTFFTALGSLKELHAEAAESVDRIQALRKELDTLDKEIAVGGLIIVQQGRKRENLRQLHDAVAQLKDIVDGVAVCECLVDSGEVEKALDKIDTLERLMAGEGEAAHAERSGKQMKDLRGAAALQGINSDMDTLRVRIGKAFESRFLSLMLNDLRGHLGSVTDQDVLMRWSSAATRVRGGHSREPSAFPAYLSATDELRMQLLPVLTGLQRAKHITVATVAYRDAIRREIRHLIRGPLPSSKDDDSESVMSSSTVTEGKGRTQQERSSSLARNLRALEPPEAEQMLVKIYIGVAETLRRLSTQAKVLLDVAYSLGDSPGPGQKPSSPVQSPPPFSPSMNKSSRAALEAQEEIHQAMDLPNLMSQTVDLAHNQIVKVLRVRREQSTHLTLAWFLRYFALNLHFANESEAISGRGGNAFKMVVDEHIKDFVQLHGHDQQQQLAQGMEADQWNAVDFTDKDSQLLARIVASSTQDAPDWKESTRIWIPYRDEGDDETLSLTSNAPECHQSTKPKMRSAVIDHESFSLPKSAVLCMKGMAQFMHLMVVIPAMTTSVSTCLIAYLVLFNSRCTQLILGAGATKSAGLKAITTKHLALASQALAFVAAMIPHVRELARRHCGSGANATAFMGEFDKIRRLIQEKKNSIYDKLVEIMNGRVTLAGMKMQVVAWDAAADQHVRAHEYMEMLVKDTAMLHRALTRHVSEATVRMIMTQVFGCYKDSLGGILRGLEPKTESGKNSMMRDLEFFRARLGRIDGFADLGQYLIDTVQGKEVEKPAEPAPQQAGPAAALTETASSPKSSAAAADVDLVPQATANGSEARDDCDQPNGGNGNADETNSQSQLRLQLQEGKAGDGGLARPDKEKEK